MTSRGGFTLSKRAPALLVVVACGTPTSPRPAPAARGLIDSHVHLTYDPVAAELVAHGFVAAVDLGAPRIVHDAPLTLIQSGPMITSPDGYPLDSWGAAGYGIACASTACVIETVDRLVAEGAGVIKLPVDAGGIAPEAVAPAVAEAHRKGVRVAVHALSNEGAALAAAAGADILAHTPVEPLADATIEAWRGRTVISTLAAFGGAPSAIANLRALRAAGVTVLYGTDLGNLRVDGVSADEVALLHAAGLDDAEVTAAMTTVPAQFWGLSR